MAKRKNSKFLKVQIKKFDSRKLIWPRLDYFSSSKFTWGPQNRLGDLQIAMTIQNMKKYLFGNQCYIFHKC